MSLTELAHSLISKRFKYINYGIDATCGNGHDTLFLSRLCNDSGMIYCFDVQESALINTSILLDNNNLVDKVKLIHKGHENMLEHVDCKVEVIMFNLGYLPNSDRKLCTDSETTVTALESSLELLSEKGLISVICYPKNEPGKLETIKVKSWTNGLNRDVYDVCEYISEKPDQTTPILFTIDRI